MFLLIAVYAFVTNRSTIGRRIYALGGNKKATRLSGIKTERLTFLVFVNMGVLPRARRPDLRRTAQLRRRRRPGLASSST